GYSLVHTGLKTISDLKNGELILHTNYFNSLRGVNPAIKNHSRVTQIAAIQLNILKAYKNTYAQIKTSNTFNPDELSYTSRVFKRLLDDCADIMNELIAVISNGKLEMKDDERLKRIDLLYRSMQDNYFFIKSFGNQAIVLA